MCFLTNERYKHIRRNFHLVACVMTQGWNLGVSWGVGVQIFFLKLNQIWCVSYLHERHMQRHNIRVPTPLGSWGGAKRSNIIKSQSQSQFQRFLNQTLCVFSQMKDIKYIRRDFNLVAWIMPQGWVLGGTVGGWRSKKYFLKFNQIWCVSYSHEWHNYLGPRLLWP